MNKVAKVLSAAAEILDEYGWIRGSFGGPERGFCAVGAVNFTIFGKGFGPTTSLDTDIQGEKFRDHVLEKFLCFLTPHKDIVRLNDAPSTTKKDVKALFLEAASLAMDGTAVRS